MTERSTLGETAKRRAGLSLAIWLLSAVQSAYAQAPDAATLEQASRSFDRGVQFAQEGSYEQAVVAFEQAYALSGSSAVLYNLGIAYVGTGRPVEASDALSRYLEHAGSELDDRQRVHIVQELARQRERIGSVALDIEPASAHVVVDGRLLAPSAHTQPLRLALGDHWLDVSEPGYQSSRSTFALTTSSRLLVIRLRALSDMPSTVTAPSAQVARADKKGRSRPPTLRIAGYGLGIAGLVTGLTALTVYLVGDARYDHWKETDRKLRNSEGMLNESSSSSELAEFDVRQKNNNDRLRSIWRLDSATTGLAIGGAALLAAGIAIVVWTSRPDDKARSRKLALRPAGLLVLGEF